MYYLIQANPASDANTDLVTITIGGNDAQFAEDLKACGPLHDCVSPDFKPYDGIAFTDWLPEKIAGLVDPLKHAFGDIKQKVGQASLYALGYPNLFPPSAAEQNCAYLTGFSNAEQNFLRQMHDQLNSVISQAAAAQGVWFVDPTQTFAGHEICSAGGDDWVYGLRLNQLSDQLIGDQSFHPNPEGQLGYATALRDFIDQKLAQGVATLPNGLPANPANFAAPSQLTGASSWATTASPLSTVGALELSPAPGSQGPCIPGADAFYPGQSVNVTGSEFAPGSGVTLAYDYELCRRYDAVLCLQLRSG